MDTLKTTKITNFPGSGKEEMRREVVALLGHFAIPFLTIGVSVYSGTIYVTAESDHSEELTSILDDMRHNNAILRAITMPVPDDYEIPLWYTQKKENKMLCIGLMSVKLTNIGADVESSVKWNQLRSICSVCGIRFMSIQISRCGGVAWITVEAKNATKLCDITQNMNFFGSRLSSYVVNVPDTYVPPDWYKDEVIANVSLSEQLSVPGDEIDESTRDYVPEEEIPEYPVLESNEDDIPEYPVLESNEDDIPEYPVLESNEEGPIEQPNDNSHKKTCDLEFKFPGFDCMFFDPSVWALSDFRVETDFVLTGPNDSLYEI